MTGKQPYERSPATRVLAKHKLPREDLAGAAGYLSSDFGRTLSEALPNELRERHEQKRQERISLMDWSMKVPEPKTGPLDWKRFPFQVELYSQEACTAEEIVVKKPTQVGISAYLLRWGLYWADVRGLTALYVFPKLKQMFDFSDARVRAVVLASKYLQQRIPNSYTQNKGLKQIGFGWCYFRGSESEDDLDSVDADVLMLDEYDRLYGPNIPVAERRISGPKSLGLKRRVGVPTIPGKGVSKLFEESDQRHWKVKCSPCGEWQSLDWANNMDLEQGKRVCARCRRELDPEDIRRGQWVPMYPGRAARGYHMNKLIVPDLKAVNLRQLIENSEKMLPEDRMAFWNRDMGVAFAPAEGRLSDEAIAAAVTAGRAAGASASGDLLPSFNLITMGVDVASTRALHVRISEHLDGRRKKAVWLGTVENFESLDKLMISMGVHMCAIDHLPEGRSARAFAERFAGKVYLCKYGGQQSDKVLRVNDTDRMATIRRTDGIDAMMGMIRQQRNLLPGHLPERYKEHLQALVRVAEKGDDGRKKVYYESVGADDFAHAEVYDLVAGELFWIRQQVHSAERDDTTLLEDHVDLERTVLRGEGDVYVAGPHEGYSPGMEEDGGYDF